MPGFVITHSDSKQTLHMPWQRNSVALYHLSWCYMGFSLLSWIIIRRSQKFLTW